MFLYTGMILLKSYELGLFDLLSGAHQLPIFGLEYESSNALDVGKRLEFFGPLNSSACSHVFSIGLLSNFESDKQVSELGKLGLPAFGGHLS